MKLWHVALIAAFLWWLLPRYRVPAIGLLIVLVLVAGL